MREKHIDEGDFQILRVKNENEKLSHFLVSDRNGELLYGDDDD